MLHLRVRGDRLSFDHVHSEQVLLHVGSPFTRPASGRALIPVHERRPPESTAAAKKSGLVPLSAATAWRTADGPGSLHQPGLTRHLRREVSRQAPARTRARLTDVMRTRPRLMGARLPACGLLNPTDGRPGPRTSARNARPRAVRRYRSGACHARPRT